jgi:hypothetical protein
MSSTYTSTPSITQFLFEQRRARDLLLDYTTRRRRPKFGITKFDITVGANGVRYILRRHLFTAACSFDGTAPGTFNYHNSADDQVRQGKARRACRFPAHRTRKWRLPLQNCIRQARLPSYPWYPVRPQRSQRVFLLPSFHSPNPRKAKAGAGLIIPSRMNYAPITEPALFNSEQ